MFLALKILLIFGGVCGVLLVSGCVYLTPKCDVTPGLVYTQRNGHDLKIDVVRPRKNANGAGVLVMISGRWISPEHPFNPMVVAPLLRHGYTIFAVHHLSQPKATVVETVEDVHRAVRFVRHHAAKYGVDPNRLGVTGASSGGHLSLMLATRGRPGDPQATDPIDRESSEIQAVAVLFPVTDLVDLGDSTENLHDGGPPAHFVEAFGMKDRDADRWLPVAREMSPVLHITGSLPPVLIHHGDEDKLIAYDRSERFQSAAAAIGKPVELVRKKGKGHGWMTMLWDIKQFAEWFDRHLLPAKSAD